jgi:hypothetical protein
LSVVLLVPARFDRRRIVVAAILSISVVTGFAGFAGSACSPAALRTSTAASPMSAPPAHTGEQARADVQAIIDKLTATADTTYTAEYALLDGNAVTVSQAPPRHAYRGLGVTYLLSPDEALLCGGDPVKCQSAPGADTVSPASFRAVNAAFGGRFVTPEDVAARLANVVNQPASRTGRGARTIGGGPADCVAVTASGISPQTACVTASGVLAYFAAGAVRIELHAYRPAVLPNAFASPSPSA